MRLLGCVDITAIDRCSWLGLLAWVDVMADWIRWQACMAIGIRWLAPSIALATLSAQFELFSFVSHNF